MPQPQIAHRPPLRRAVGQPEQNGEDREQDRDLPGLAEVVGDRIACNSAGDRRGDRGDGDEPHDALVGCGDLPASDRAEERAQQAADVPCEVRDDGRERAEVQRDVERLVEGVVLLEEAPVREPGNEDEMAGRRDGQQFGEPLGDSERQSLPVGKRSRHLADTGRGEQHGEKQGCGGHGVDPDAAHLNEYRSARR